MENEAAGRTLCRLKGLHVNVRNQRKMRKPARVERREEQEGRGTVRRMALASVKKRGGDHERSSWAPGQNEKNDAKP